MTNPICERDIGRSELYLLEEVHEHIARRLWEERLTTLPLHDPYYHITPKPFTAEQISPLARWILPPCDGRHYSFSGMYITQRMPGVGRVFFFPNQVEIQGKERFVEVKGYGRDGTEMCLWTHADGDICFGMFYHNAIREYDILERAAHAGLRVPTPLLLGKIPRDVWFKSGLKSAELVFEEENLSGRFIAEQASELEAYLKQIAPGFNKRIDNDPLGAFNQPDDAGFLARGVLSPFRLGDPSDLYELTQRNKWIAAVCGKTFYHLIDLGYFHHCPGTGNWTTQGELTDLVDCHDLLHDDSIASFISRREAKEDVDYWEDLIGPRHTSTLSPFFIQGMLGEEVSVTEAAQELKRKVNGKLRELKKSVL